MWRVDERRYVEVERQGDTEVMRVEGDDDVMVR